MQKCICVTLPYTLNPAKLSPRSRAVIIPIVSESAVGLRFTVLLCCFAFNFLEF